MQNNKTSLPVTILLFAVAFLTGCSLTADVEATIKRDMETAVTAMEASRLPSRAVPMDTVQVRDDIWLGESSVKISQGEPLPSELETSNGITLVGGRPVSLLEIAEQVTALTDIPVRMDDLLLGDLSSGSGSGGGQEGQSSAELGTSTGGTDAGSVQMVLAYSGPLSGLLEQVASRLSLWWRYQNGVITFYQLETRVFTVYAMPTETSGSSTLGGSASGSGGGTSTSASGSVSSSVNLQVWNDISQTIQGMLPSSASLVTSPATGTVTVTAPPYTLARISRYIREQNRRLARQVAIGVKVLMVSIDDTDTFGLDFTAMFNSLNGTGFQQSINSPYNAASGVSGIGMAILDSATENPFDKWRGSEAVIEAISKQGTVSVVTSTAVTTLNNKIAPVQVTTDRAYVSEITEETDSDGNSEVTIDTDTLTYGVTMQLLPRILDHGRMILMFNMALTNLITIETESFTTGRVQLPEVETRGFLQEVVLKSGSTLVLSGFEQFSNRVTKSGLGSADFSLWGGSNTSERTRSVLVVLLTPEVLESPLDASTRISSR